jgi:hypothetical protein
MAKISRIGGFTDATARGFVSPADELRARGKLGPYDAGKTEEPADVDDATADPDTPAAADADMPAAAEPDDAAVTDADALEDEEESWPGNSSKTSLEKPPKNDGPRKPSPRKRARSAGGHSGSTTASGTAPTGTTSGPVTGA